MSKEDDDDADIEAFLVSQLESRVFSPHVKVNDLANTYIVLLELGVNQQATSFFSDAERRLANEFTSLSDGIVRRLYEDLVRAAVFPPRPRDIPLVRALTKWSDLDCEDSNLNWRLRFNSSFRPGTESMWKIRDFSSQPVTQSFGPGKSTGTFLPPTTYEDYKNHTQTFAQISWDSNPNVKAIQGWTQAGSVGVLTGALTMMLGRSVDEINNVMLGSAPLDELAFAVSATTKGGISNAGASRFGPGVPRYGRDVPESRFASNESRPALPTNQRRKSIVPPPLLSATNEPLTRAPLNFSPVPSFILQERSSNDNADLVDVSGGFFFAETVEGGAFVKMGRGKLGVPGRVVKHRLTGLDGQRGVSAGTGDHAGHLFADRFGAPGDHRNLSLQNWIQNTGNNGKRGTWYALEDEWAYFLLDGYQIEAEVKDFRRQGEERPYKRTATWTMTAPDGTKTYGEWLGGNWHTPESRDAQGLNKPNPPKLVGPNLRRSESFLPGILDPNVLGDLNAPVDPNEMGFHPVPSSPFTVKPVDPPPRQPPFMRPLPGDHSNDDPFHLNPKK